MRKQLLSVAASFLLLSPAFSAEYFVVVPVKGKEAPAGMTVALSDVTLPVARIGNAYSYDFKPHLLVTGDPALDLARATWSTASTIPAGLSLDATGVLQGTPTSVTAGAAITLRASYKAKSAERMYSLQVEPAVVYAKWPETGTQSLSVAAGAGWRLVSADINIPVAKSGTQSYYYELVRSAGSTSIMGFESPTRGGYIAGAGWGTWYGSTISWWFQGNPLNMDGWSLSQSGPAAGRGDVIGVLVTQSVGSTEVVYYLNCARHPVTPYQGAAVSIRPAVFLSDATTVEANFGQKPFSCPVPAGAQPGVYRQL